MLVRAHDPSGCMQCDLDAAGGGEVAKIKRSVGAGGANAPDDVLAVQRLLNGVAPEDGGPVPLLAEDKLVGPLTTGAIKRFQTEQKLKVVDSRVDPGGPTIKRLNEVSAPGRRAIAMLRALLGGAVPPADSLGALPAAARQALRLQRVQLAIAPLVDMARRAERAAEMAMDHVTQGGRLGAAPAAAFRRADHYFAFGRQPQDRTVAELRFIRTTFSRARTVLANPRPSVFGGSPFGAAIFDIDPLGRPWHAYSPRQSADTGRKDGVTSGRIYLCDRIDFNVQDLFVHVLMHETIHFVDDETPAREIDDANNGYREGALLLAHRERMHNSDNYALFASHTAMGRARLVASQPTLAPVVPADLP